MPNMWLHFVNLLSQGGQAFLAALGTTGLGWWVQGIIWFAATETATYLVVWRLRGKDAMKARLAENFRIGFYAWLIVMICIYGPIFGWHVVRAVYEDHQNLVAKIERLENAPKPAAPICPVCATVPLSPAQIGVSLQSLLGVNVEGEVHDFKTRREYMMKVTNTGMQSAKAVSFHVQFPYLVEARRIISSQGAQQLTFEPESSMVFPTGSPIVMNGCQANNSYKLKASSVEPSADIKILFILNSIQTMEPEALYISGDFIYGRKQIKGNYYAPMKLTQSDEVVLLQPRQAPANVKYALGFALVPPPCIANDALRLP